LVLALTMVDVYFDLLPLSYLGEVGVKKHLTSTKLVDLSVSSNLANRYVTY